RRPVPHYVARGRHIAIYLARQLTGKSFRALSHLFGDSAHSGLVKAFRIIEGLRSAHADLDADLAALARELGSTLPPRAPHGLSIPQLSTPAENAGAPNHTDE